MNRGNIFFFSQDYVKENTYNYILLSYLLSSFTLQKFVCVWNINFKCLWKRKYSQWLIEPNNMIRSTTVEYNVYNNIFSWWPNYHVILSSKFYSKHLNSQINFMSPPPNNFATMQWNLHSMVTFEIHKPMIWYSDMNQQAIRW